MNDDFMWITKIIDFCRVFTERVKNISVKLDFNSRILAIKNTLTLTITNQFPICCLLIVSKVVVKFRY